MSASPAQSRSSTTTTATSILSVKNSNVTDAVCVPPPSDWTATWTARPVPSADPETLSLDYTTTNDKGDERSWLDDLPDVFAVVDVAVEEAELLDALHLLLASLSPEDMEICKTIMADLSERAAAASLNISRKAFMYRRDKVLTHLKNSLKKYL